MLRSNIDNTSGTWSCFRHGLGHSYEILLDTHKDLIPVTFKIRSHNEAGGRFGKYGVGVGVVKNHSGNVFVFQGTDGNGDAFCKARRYWQDQVTLLSVEQPEVVSLEVKRKD